MIREIYGDEVYMTGVFDSTLDELPFHADIDFFNDPDHIDDLIVNSTHFAVAIGGEHGFARYDIAKKLVQKNLKPLAIISPNAIIDTPDFIGDGLQAMPGAVVHKFTNIGTQCILNCNATVDHDCTIGHGVHIMGAAAVTGNVRIGNFSTIGTNATILPNLTIGQNVIVGAGAVVTKDVEDGVVVVGTPARAVRLHRPHAAKNNLL